MLPSSALFTVDSLPLVYLIDIERPKIDCLSLVMCPLLAQLKTGFFSIFFAAAVYSTTEANKASLKQSIILRCLWFTSTGFKELTMVFGFL
jgi:hypothetical protein